MKTLWLTYSWEDNKENDIEFIAQEIEKHGINVKIDRWDLTAGKRLWEQIDQHITSPDSSDGWAIVASQNSLSSQKCKEELAYALTRALNTRGGEFPIIGIFTSSINPDLIPSAIKTRLYVSISDQDWIERIVSALENRKPTIQRTEILPYYVTVWGEIGHPKAIEVRPRAGSWVPFFFAIPIDEQKHISPRMLRGAKNIVPQSGSLSDYNEIQSTDGNWLIIRAGDEATPTMSYYLLCQTLPSAIWFGVFNGSPQFFIDDLMDH